MAKLKTVMCEQGGRFIHPEDVGSAIQWRVGVRVREADPTAPEWDRKAVVTTFSELHISSCERGIMWSIDPDEEESIAKLDAAISELRKVRAAVAQARRLRAAHMKRLGLEK